MPNEIHESMLLRKDSTVVAPISSVNSTITIEKENNATIKEENPIASGGGMKQKIERISECKNDENNDCDDHRVEELENVEDIVQQVKTEKKKRPSLTKEERIEKKKRKLEEIKRKSGELVASLVLKSLKRKMKKEEKENKKSKTTKRRKRKNLEENIEEKIEVNVDYQVDSIDSQEDLGGDSIMEVRQDDVKKPLWKILMEKMERDIALFNATAPPCEDNVEPPPVVEQETEPIGKNLEEKEKPKKKQSFTQKTQKRTLKTASNPPPKRKLITSDINTNEDYEKNRKRTKQTKILSFFQLSQSSSK